MMKILEQKTVIFLKEHVNSINRTATIIKIDEEEFRVSNNTSGRKEVWNSGALRSFLSNNEIVLV